MVNEGNNEFSYEDMGSFGLSVKLLLMQIVFWIVIFFSYIRQISENERYFSPHVIMMASL